MKDSIQVDEYWEGFTVAGATIPAGLTLSGAGVSIPTFDTIRGRGPTAAMPAGEYRQGMTAANRMVIWVRGSTNAWSLNVQVARFSGDPPFNLIGAPHIAAGVLQAVLSLDVHCPYVTFDILETSGINPVDIDVWFRLLSYGRGF
jgi:hypothetical protein